MPKQQTTPMMGDRVREVVTGKTGVITGTTEYLWGCEQCLVYLDGETDKDGDPKSQWWDVNRLEVVERNAVSAFTYAAAPVSVLTATGTVDKSGWFRRNRSPRGAFAGPDKPAPQR